MDVINTMTLRWCMKRIRSSGKMRGPGEVEDIAKPVLACEPYGGAKFFGDDALEEQCYYTVRHYTLDLS